MFGCECNPTTKSVFLFINLLFQVPNSKLDSISTMAAFSHHHHLFLHQTTAFHPHSTTHNFSGHQPTTAFHPHSTTHNFSVHQPTTTAAAAACLLDQDHHHRTKNLQRKGYSTSMEVDGGSHDHLAMKRKAINGISQVRRKKINERMKLLQSIVPGCDQVIASSYVDRIWFILSVFL
ncbi:Myc-type, basic helix-loop-helix (bHLH) domain-containing protein [Cynara cardunculus var. scolymus]|uniref:Myc-type, basic helix-loop-helix (BHLH) domain-containing protein n=1 Tax=Cynara cardunculus var. scolymus TaxID=59895 RepID=A0A103XWD9_CYNCS|nr:Myc-type, basic helix-loop-helix (bHLH) domain-containing protein [Cynara cardunculus var. scolymus]